MGNAHTIFFRMLTAAATTLGVASPAVAFDSAAVEELARQAAQKAATAIFQGYDAAPALMLGVALAIAFPLMTLVIRILQRVRRPRDVTRRYKSNSQDVSAAITGDATGHHGPAFVEVVGSSTARYAIPRDMLRIGREDDNDIRIPSGAVHRYHAAIHREDLGDWHITDLSGVDGNGIVINGRRCGDAQLHDGDLIELGPGRLRFRAGYA